ncbi:hypothetical protein WN944_009043 [Citrus x changshan-huyou]|uniref:Helicase C-terminal domain-containing protein n=1 Tax=Citrus x changshan-huyou TaxID=2935761 RepID=A0AAP0MP12_9ROSI
MKAKPLDPSEKLINISEMPERAKPAFKGMTQLNRVRSRVYESAFFSANNILLCAPTKTGKTNVSVLTILQQLALNKNDGGSFNHSNYKIVYVAPMRALVAELVKLLTIDEIHLLHDNKGPVLESIIARTVRRTKTTKEHIRYRPVLENGLLHFDNGYRPVQLSQQYIGIEEGDSKNCLSIRDIALENDTLGRFLKEEGVSLEILQSHTDMVTSNDFKDLLPYGFAIHHADMTRVLVSTATLAWGVNLLARTVIIEGTQIYNPKKGAWTELSPLDIMRMLGRAGRPQYDSYGEGIIITEIASELCKMLKKPATIFLCYEILHPMIPFVVLLSASRLLQVMVDVISSNGWLQKIWLSDAKRTLEKVLKRCLIWWKWRMMKGMSLADVGCGVGLEQDLQGRTEVGPVYSNRCPKAKEEGWWLVLEAGKKTYTLYFMCDSCMGCDREYSFTVDVKEAGKETVGNLVSLVTSACMETKKAALQESSKLKALPNHLFKVRDD